MSLGSLETRRVRPRYDSDFEEDAGDIENTDSDSENGIDPSNISNSSESDQTENEEEAPEEGSDNESQDDEAAELAEISFGALAKAQATFQPQSRKRKRSDIAASKGDHDHNDGKDPAAQVSSEKWEWTSAHKDRPKQDLSRSSKHAPTIQSTRNPVSRKRTVFSPPASEKSRDPRFDAPIKADASRGNPNSVQAATKNYAFLSEYQAREVLDLKAQLKQTKDATMQAQLKRQLMSLEAKLRNAATQRRETEIVREHRQKERAAIREGRKKRAFYLKPSEIRQRVAEERASEMSQGARDKAERRKRKREKTKESKDMPRSRRML